MRKSLDPTRMLWPDGPARVLFSIAAVLSASILYISVAVFQESPRLFAAAVLILFAGECLLFEKVNQLFASEATEATEWRGLNSEVVAAELRRLSFLRSVDAVDFPSARASASPSTEARDAATAAMLESANASARAFGSMAEQFHQLNAEVLKTIEAARSEVQRFHEEHRQAEERLRVQHEGVERLTAEIATLRESINSVQLELRGTGKTGGELLRQRAVRRLGLMRQLREFMEPLILDAWGRPEREVLFRSWMRLHPHDVPSNQFTGLILFNPSGGLPVIPQTEREFLERSEQLLREGRLAELDTLVRLYTQSRAGVR